MDDDVGGFRIGDESGHQGVPDDLSVVPVDEIALLLGDLELPFPFDGMMEFQFEVAPSDRGGDQTVKEPMEEIAEHRLMKIGIRPVDAAGFDLHRRELVVMLVGVINDFRELSFLGHCR